MKPELQAIYDANRRDFWHLTPAQIMGITLWAETRGEPESGKIAVASVIIERVNHRKWDGESIHEVCLWPKQFSCFNPSDVQRPIMVLFANGFERELKIESALKHCYDISVGILSGKIPRDIDIMRSHCCQYLTTAAKAHCGWWKTMKFVKKVGAHEFFSER